MKTTRVLTSFLMVAGASSACKSRTEVGASAKDAGESPLIGEIKAALEDNGCDGCHSEVAASDLRQWAALTKGTDERILSEGDSSFNPSTFNAAGIYKAYPEYFRDRFPEKFSDATVFKAFEKRLRPKPAMKFPGSEPEKKEAFTKLHSLMTALAQETASETASGCTPKISEKLKKHIREMETQGWAAKLLTGDNGGRSFQSFGCPSNTVDPLKCFRDATKFKERSDAMFAQSGVDSARLVEVGNVGKTYYWTRSSMDGRYVGNGGSSEEAHIDDLQEKVRYYIGGKRYDSGFFPDNSGFTFHGSPALFCSMDVLAETSNETSTVTVGGEQWKTVQMDPGAAHNKNRCLSDTGRPSGVDDGPSSSISTYQSIGSGQGSKAYALTGSHSTDIGSYREDNTSFSGELKLYELRKANGTFERVSAEPMNFMLPNEGDYGLSPSSRYIAGRIAGPSSKQLGYRVRSLADMIAGGASFDPATDDSVSSICLTGSGSKPNWSIDERFIAFHQYADNKSDIYLVDLLNDGKVYRVSNVPAGTRALFPHFRADGWLYFLLATGDSWGGGENLILGSDIAIRIAESTAASH